MVEHRKSKSLYALKYIDKAKCIKQKAIANIIQERRLLEEVEQPFAVLYIFFRANITQADLSFTGKRGG